MVDLPAGTVTLLFTDIEDSSSKWDADSEAMQACLAVHNDILDRAVSDHGGHVVKTMGDGYMVVFDRPDRAIEAAVAAQRVLTETDWGGQPGPLTVRMGIHTGIAELLDEDYFGPAVNRSARIEAAGHGGQILISAATMEMAAALFGSGIDIVDLGRHELRGLSRPERIYQVVGDGLESDFPHLRTAEAGVLRNAPAYHTSFIGRAADLADIEHILTQGERFVTLVGPGGTGKTRLAAEVAAGVVGSFAHGAVFCQLAAVESEDLVVSAVVDALGLAVDTHGSDLGPRVQVLDYLRHRSMLVVLDNFEQLLEASAFVQDLLTASDGVSVLVTSRERLRLSGETVYEVGGLNDRSESDDSAELFVARASQVDPGYEDDPASVSRISAALGGSPLGIELAAAWAEVLTPAEIAAEVEASLEFVESQERDRDDRHRSLRAVFDASWNRLDSDQQLALRRLAVFRGGFDREAAGAVAGADLRTMSALVAKSLVRRPQPGRFDFHPLIGQFVARGLEESGEHDPLTEGHAGFYLELLRSERDNLDGAAQAEARDRLREDAANLRTALQWLADNGDADEIVELLEAVYLFYLAHSWHEGLELFDDLSARTARRSDPGFDAETVSAAIDATVSYLVAWLGDLDRAVRLAEAAMAVLDDETPGVPLASAWAARGAVHVLRGDQPPGQALLKQALEALDPDGHASLYSLICTTYGWSFFEEGDFDRADEIFTEGLRVADRTGATLARAYSISKLGLTAEAAGDHRRAIDHHHEGREAFVKMGDPAGEAYTLSRLSWTYGRVGEYERARECALEAQFLFEQLNHRWGTLATMSRLGMAEVGLEELDSTEMHFRLLIERSVEFTMPQMGDLYGVIGLAYVAGARGKQELATQVFSSFESDPDVPKSFFDMYIGPGLDRIRQEMDREEFEKAEASGVGLSGEDRRRLLDVPI